MPSHDKIKRILELFIIRKERPVGRYALKDMLDLPEGKTRGRLARLRDEELIEETKQGATITEKGERELRRLLSSMSIAAIDIIDVGALKTGHESAVIHVCGRAGKIGTAEYTELRDEAVRVGAQGATIIIFGDGKLSVPAVFPDLETEYQSIAKILLEKFDLQPGDVIVVGSALTEWKALEGALAVASALGKK